MSDTFRRMQEFDRRAELVRATLDCIADKGIQGATVRAVAAAAGVSIGLIRHHFETKENMVLEAYRETIRMLTAPCDRVLVAEIDSPHERLARFIRASIGGEISDLRILSLWAAFMSQLNADPEMKRIHDEAHLPYRSSFEPLIGSVMAAEGRHLAPAEIARLAIAMTAVIDGLWLEGCLPKQAETSEDYVAIGLEAAEALLRVALPRPTNTKD
ncbi:TetR family transcriptional regulator C-terminal domain-containing protein [Rhodobacter lacus]|uniref:TetR family transcriptional regulator C-terminal domain-containing protein n=1 Tax=Rhodobacter lacus TaxID=1641972 RepID=A0ABW5A9L3_9RHOB